MPLIGPVSQEELKAKGRRSVTTSQLQDAVSKYAKVNEVTYFMKAL